MLGIIVGLLCATTWAASSIMMRGLARKLDPFTLNAPRALIGGLAMFLLTLATGRAGLYHTVTSEKLLLLVGSMAIGGGLGDTLYVVAMTRIGVARAFPIASSYPALTMIFGLLFLAEPFSPSVAGGLLLVLGGIYLISKPNNTLDSVAPRANNSGIALASSAAVFWAVSTLLVAPAVQGLDSLMAASIRAPSLGVLLGIVVIARGTGSTLLKLSRRDWVMLVVSGIVGWGLGSVLWLWSIALLGGTKAAIITSAAPLFALPLSVIFLKERLTPLILLGTALAVGGVILVC